VGCAHCVGVGSNWGDTTYFTPFMHTISFELMIRYLIHYNPFSVGGGWWRGQLQCIAEGEGMCPFLHIWQVCRVCCVRLLSVLSAFVSDLPMLWIKVGRGEGRGWQEANKPKTPAQMASERGGSGIRLLLLVCSEVLCSCNFDVIHDERSKRLAWASSHTLRWVKL